MLSASGAAALSWIRLREGAHDLHRRGHRRLGPALAHRLPNRLSRAVTPAPAHQLTPLLDALGHLRPHARFVQVGSNDGDQQDPLRDAILRFGWRGVMVEPVPYVFDRLEQNYGGRSGIALANVAVGPIEGKLPFFHLSEITTDEDHERVPRWYDALGSFSRAVVLSHRSSIPDLEERLIETLVDTVTFSTLCDRYGIDQVDVLHIDTEGHDYEVVKLVDFGAVRPLIVIYEHHHLSPSDRAACRGSLEALGYDTVEYGLDTWCIDVAGLRSDEASLGRLWRSLRRAAERTMRPAALPDHLAQITELSADDVRYLTSPYDDRVPLPSDADEELRSDHPRLAGLRARYAACGIPAAVPSQWRTEAVEEHVDLRYFRGDTMFQWHYRELPRATNLKLFIYLSYLSARDDRHLLSRLIEDGAFGCWTYEYDSRPTVSRDLLESVNELLFLDRELGVLDRPDLRVLDIGAGYGRLAHRACEAIPSIADYCCADAVPESTFLCEYYLRHRGVRARVVPLDELMPAIPAGAFDLAINVHSFSECTREAVRWWLDQLVAWEVPTIFAVPNEPAGFLSREVDGTRLDLLECFDDAGYELTHREPVIADAAVRDLLRIEDQFHLFTARSRRPADA